MKLQIEDFGNYFLFPVREISGILDDKGFRLSNIFLSCGSGGFK
jgi:hypothetical protein